MESWAATNLFGPNNSGAVINASPNIKAAVDNLVSLSHPGTTARLDNTVSSIGGTTGTDLSGVTAGLQAGNPAILAVCFPGTDCSSGSDHQVLAVGIAKIGNAIYYVITNSGHSIYDPLPALQAGGQITLPTLYNCTASSQRTDHPYASIYRYRVLGGLQSVTNFQLKSVFQ